MTKRTFDSVTIEGVWGNIASQPDMDAIVNAANAGLRMGDGVAGAIHRAAGPGLEEECQPLAPIGPGQAVITSAHDLPNRHVIHCLGPVYGQDEPSAVFLADCYRNALKLAELHGIRSIAFPAISTGAFGYPMEAAVRVALTAILEKIPLMVSVVHIRFVMFDDKGQGLFARILNEIEY